ncbi:MAG: phosphoglycerate kinase [Alphaproteobacteria bacterium]
MARFHTLDDMALDGRRVLVRVDLNVPLKDGVVTDATRIERLVPTVRALREAGARVVLMSHFGRPKGKRVPEMSLAPVRDALAAALGTRPTFAEDCIGAEAKAVVDALGPGGVALLENLRYHAGEEANDSDFAAALAELGDVYINDAFSCAHRAHASTDAIARCLPALAGRAMQAELEALQAALGDPKRPVMAIVGGAKVSTKLAVLGHLVDRVDHLVIGGGMANTFLHAQGINVGTSLCEPDLADQARAIMAKAETAGCAIVLPPDVVVATALKPNVDTATIVVEKAPDEMMILDVGPRAVLDLKERLGQCKTLVWNGPLGAFETPPFDVATLAIAREAARLTQAGGLTSVAGGGDTVAAVNAAGVGDQLSYVSTAGGAFLEWLEGKTLPGVAALEAAAG